MKDKFNSMPTHVQNQFVQAALRFEPERLSCDGELSRTEVQQLFKQRHREWHQLCQAHRVNFTPDEVMDTLY